jgi:hypothetical protein
LAIGAKGLTMNVEKMALGLVYPSRPNGEKNARRKNGAPQLRLRHDILLGRLAFSASSDNMHRQGEGDEAL